MTEKRILVVEMDPVVRSGICNFLGAHGHTVFEASSCRDALLQVQRLRPDAVIVDFSLPNGDAPQLLCEIKALNPATPVLVLTGQGNSALGIRAIQQGAEYFLIKPIDLEALRSLVHRMLSGGKNGLAPQPPMRPKREPIDPFVGNSSAITRLRDLATRVIDSESPILLQGETGSGKGVLANWIHCNGPRGSQPFLDLNCAGLSRELLESELFGYEKGAFTSAVSSKPGLLEVANRGTVFLDEIGDIDLQVQPKLLKVLEDRIFRRLGDVRDRTVDIRLISATHRELLELVQQQRFRADLYFRVNIVYLRVPPLRERIDDIRRLAQHMLAGLATHCRRDVSSLSGPAIQALERYSWPGNIRELRNVLERAVLVAEGGVIRTEHLQFQGSPVGEPRRLVGATGTLKQMESAYIKHVLHDENGSIERSARRLGIPRSSLYNKMKRFEIPPGTGRL